MVEVFCGVWEVLLDVGGEIDFFYSKGFVCVENMEGVFHGLDSVIYSWEYMGVMVDEALEDALLG